MHPKLVGRKHMRRSFLLSLLLVGFSFSSSRTVLGEPSPIRDIPPPASQSNTKPIVEPAAIAITIGVAAQPVESNKEVVVSLSIKNISSGVVMFNNMYGYKLNIYDKEGNEPQKTQLLQQIETYQYTNGSNVKLINPGESYSQQIPLGKLYKMPAGKYTVYVIGRPILQPLVTPTAVKSNTITISVN